MIGAPLSSAARHAATIVPRFVVTARTVSPPGAPGFVNGTTDGLSGDWPELAPMSLIAATRNATCVP